MERQKVQSSNINSIGYDKESQTLEIEFHSGGTYQYYGVQQNIYEFFMTAGSKGKYFYRNIKKRYRFKKVK